MDNRQHTLTNVHLLLCLILLAQLSSFYLEGEEASLGSETVSVITGASSSMDEGAIKREINKIVEELHETDPLFLKGITSIMVSQEDIDFLADSPFGCGGHLLGALANDTIIIKESGTETNRRTLYHEAGHNRWKQLTAEEQEQWPFKEPFVSTYASLDAEEDFADSFACLKTNFSLCRNQLSEEKTHFLARI